MMSSIYDKFPYVLDQEAEIFYDGKWWVGKIVNGYRFQDGLVTIETIDGKKLWCGVERSDYRPHIVFKSIEPRTYVRCVTKNFADIFKNHMLELGYNFNSTWLNFHACYKIPEDKSGYFKLRNDYEAIYRGHQVVDFIDLIDNDYAKEWYINKVPSAVLAVYENLKRLNNNIEKIKELKDGFVTEHGQTLLHQDDLDKALEFIVCCHSKDVIQPEIFPYYDGSGIQFEWDIFNWYIEVGIENNKISYLILNNRDEFKSKDQKVDCTEASLENTMNLIKMLIIGIERMEEVDEYNKRNGIKETDD